MLIPILQKTTLFSLFHTSSDFRLQEGGPRGLASVIHPDSLLLQYCDATGNVA